MLVGQFLSGASPPPSFPPTAPSLRRRLMVTDKWAKIFDSTKDTRQEPAGSIETSAHTQVFLQYNVKKICF